jgi:hypothetical protein
MPRLVSRRDFIGATLGGITLLGLENPVVAENGTGFKKYHFEDTMKAALPNRIVKDWCIIVPRPENIAGYQEILSHTAHCLEYPVPFKEVFDENQRPLLVGSIEGAAGTMPNTLSVVSTIEANLFPIKGVHGNKTLSPVEQVRYTQPLPSLNFTNPDVLQWFKDKQMVIGKDESVEDFSRRVMEFVFHNIPFGVSNDVLLSRVIKDQVGYDCSAHSAIPVGILRANQIPSRLLAGRYIDGGLHIKCEAFDNGKGWIPIDASFGIFAEHDGKHIAITRDTDLEVALPNMGNKTFTLMQMPACYSQSYSGSLKDQSIKDSWNFTPL